MQSLAHISLLLSPSSRISTSTYTQKSLSSDQKLADFTFIHESRSPPIKKNIRATRSSPALVTPTCNAELILRGRDLSLRAVYNHENFGSGRSI